MVGGDSKVYEKIDFNWRVRSGARTTIDETSPVYGVEGMVRGGGENDILVNLRYW